MIEAFWFFIIAAVLTGELRDQEGRLKEGEGRSDSSNQDGSRKQDQDHDLRARP